jgi:hypothetical protein
MGISINPKSSFAIEWQWIHCQARFRATARTELFLPCVSYGSRNYGGVCRSSVQYRHARRFIKSSRRHAVGEPARTLRHSVAPAGELDAFRRPGYSEQQVIGVSLAIASITFGNLVNRINDTVIDFPPPPQPVRVSNESTRG